MTCLSVSVSGGILAPSISSLPGGRERKRGLACECLSRVNVRHFSLSKFGGAGNGRGKAGSWETGAYHRLSPTALSAKYRGKGITLPDPAVGVLPNSRTSTIPPEQSYGLAIQLIEFKR